MITGVVDFAMGFVFACYILAQKERLAEQVRRLGQAVFSERQYIRAEGDLGAITYDDSRTVLYEYNQHLLTKAENFDGKGFHFSYSKYGSGAPNRMSTLTGYDGSDQYEIQYDYCTGYTQVFDSQGNCLKYHFNSYGNTLSIQDSMGKAVYAKYAQDSDDSAGKG